MKESLSAAWKDVKMAVSSVVTKVAWKFATMVVWKVAMRASITVV